MHFLKILTHKDGIEAESSQNSQVETVDNYKSNENHFQSLLPTAVSRTDSTQPRNDRFF